MKEHTKRGERWGIYAQIGREIGRHRSTVKEAIEVYKNPKLCRRYADILEQRRADLRKYEEVTGGRDGQ